MAGALQTQAQSAGFIWIEGEHPTALNVQPQPEGVGNPHFLSESNWLKISIESGQVESAAPAEGVLVEYRFQAPAAGDYDIWNRVGYEFVRSPFDWGIDQGEWKHVTPEELTTDLMELSFWTEIAWLKLARQALSAGEHTLRIRLPKAKDTEGKWRRILYASDALCLCTGEFRPYKYFKPGEDHQTDQDRAAGREVFELPEARAPGTRTTVTLNGTWEICRHDEQLPDHVAAPIRDLPVAPRWTAIAVPGDKNQRDDLVFAHRLWYRTRVRVPVSLADRAFFLVFPQNNLNTTVHVNGQYCGFDKNPFARVQIDLGRAVKPGVNEIWVGIKDAWYGYSASPTNPLKLRKRWNLPRKYLGDGFQDLAYPIWNHPQSGILLAPELVAAGGLYVADVFCQPSVARKELTLDVTLKNPGPKDLSGEITFEAINPKTGSAEKTFAPRPVTLAAGQENALRISESWANPKLWWPDQPNLYCLRSTISVAGRVIDVSETTFGFREWSSEGKAFTLNQVPWHGWADCFTASGPQEWLRFYKEKNQTTMRFWGTRWLGLPPEQALQFFDENGVVCRRSGMLDGQAIGNMAIETDPDLKKLHGSEVKMDLMRNWLDQMVAQVKGERNHPAIQIWSLENEWLYINCLNLYASLMDKFEAEVLKCSDAVRAADPTRLTMTDGGGANKDNAMPVHGNHYLWDSKMTQYPDLAYDPNPAGGGRGRWVWDQQRPRFIGEDYFIAGHHPELSCLGGEAAFTGKTGTLPASGLMARILAEGYRWAEYGAFHFWMSQTDTDGSHYLSFAPRAIFCRQWDWTFGSGQTATRTFGLFNDTHSHDPITFTWTLSFNRQRFAGESRQFRVAPGQNEKLDLALTLPTVAERSEGELVLTLAVGGQEVFKDMKEVSVLNPKAGLASPSDAAGSARERPPAPGPDAEAICVFDPLGSVSAFLESVGRPFTALKSLASLPEDGRVLLVGNRALTESDSGSSRLAAWAASGRAVIVLEQDHPLKFQALPCDMEPASNEGRTGFAEDLDHPALQGLKQKDFFTWEPGSGVYRNAYLKPTRGAKSLIQCDQLLRHSALVEVSAGQGVMLLSQLCIGEKLASNAVAQTVLCGLIRYGATYKQEFLPVAAVCPAESTLAKVLDATGLKYTPVGDPLAALETGRIVVIAATPANLKTLASNLERVKRFTADGGWIVCNGLTPEGLDPFNTLVGVQHMIRPFRREKVTFAPVKNHLTAGLTSGDVALYSAERIFPWQEGNFVADDTFNYVVDYDEIAPFARFPSDYFYNMVNGMVSADAWKYIFSFELQRGDQPEWDMVFPAEQEFTEWTWVGNAFYHLVTRLELTFDGRDKILFETQPNNQPQTFTIHPPRRARTVRAKIVAWEKVPNKNDVVGVDNLFFKAKRSPDFYAKVKPMLNVGGLVEYPQGRGGLVLCNVLYRETEPVPANGPKKQAVLATILRNLKAPFAGKSIIPGANLSCTPIDLSKQANAFRDEKGWFGDPRFTFKDLPPGRQTFAGVTYDIYEFPTSPVPTVLMLSEKASKPATEIRAIPVHRKADALFFLHTMKLDRRMNDDDHRKNRQYETLRYLVTYADGKTDTIPVHAELDIHDYRQQTPQIIPGAQIAWTKRYDGTDYTAVAYAKQWNNPRPDLEITTIDMLPGAQPRGIPALLAVTAATSQVGPQDRLDRQKPASVSPLK